MRHRLEPRGELPERVRLRCSSCKAIFILKLKRKEASPASAAPASRPLLGNVLVLVANESAEFCQLLRNVIESQTDYRVEEAYDGETAWKRIVELTPKVIVSDVALPGLYGYEIASRVRGEEKVKESKIVLVASIYDKTRYKRSPSQLYGADDYVEKHHIPDELVPKINRLLWGMENERRSDPARLPPPVAVESVPKPEVNAAQEKVLRSTEAPVPEVPPSDGEAHDRAKRLARIIVADIALYNQEVLEEGARGGDLEALLEREISEARELYAQRVPAGIREGSRYLEEELSRLFSAAVQRAGGGDA